MSTSKRPPVHYVDNDKFLAALIEYKIKTDAAKAKGLTRNDAKWPRVPEYIGDCFLKIATHLAYRYNFIGYTFRDDMISDGIENCLTYVTNFDPERGKKPFAYFTQIAFYAFVRRIVKEQKQLATKYKYIESMDLHDMITQNQDSGEFENEFLKYLQEQLDKVEESKRPPVDKPKKAKRVKV